MDVTLNTAIILLLSAIPFIESRGAMFYGFSVGITDWAIYAAAVMVNVAQAYIYPRVFAGFLSEKRSYLAEAARHLKARIGKVSPSFFLFAIPMFGNGINTFSSTLISVWLGFKGYQKYVAGGVVLRGALTFAILSGASFLEPSLVQSALKLLLCGYVLYMLFSARGWIAKKFGLVWRKTPAKEYAIAGALLLVLCSLLLVRGEIAAPLSQLFSLFYYSSSPGKLISFVAFLAAVFFAKVFLSPAVTGSKKIDWTVFFYFILPLIAICLVGLGITSYYAADARNQLGEFNLSEIMQYGLFTFDSNSPLGISITSFHYNHNHVLKAAAFLPVLVAFPELDQKYAMSINFYYRLPFLFLVVLFAAIVFIALAAIANCCRFSGLQLGFCAVLSYLALVSAMDMGVISQTTLAAIAGLSILSLKEERRLSGMVLLAIFFFAIDSSQMYREIDALPAIRSIAMAAGFYFAYAEKKPHTQIAFAIAAVLGWPDARAIALPVAAFFTTFISERRIIYDVAAFGAFVYAMYLETWTLPVGIGHSIMPICISAAALVAGKGTNRIFLGAVLAFAIFASLPAYQAGYSNNNFDKPLPGYVAIYSDWVGSPFQEENKTFIILEGLNGTLHSTNLSLPEIYRHELVCFYINFSKSMKTCESADAVCPGFTKTYFSADASCSELFGEPSGEIRKEAAETTVFLWFYAGEDGNCIVKSASNGFFPACRYIRYWAFQNASRSRNVTGMLINERP